ncbi:Heat-inducible transcription repressor HrcA [bacterium HR34]|nr:Heat-inducible transcription repressor HrcA [bacterium HR34]
MITERQMFILENIIENYVKNCKPVASKHLEKVFKRNFGLEISAPLIRKEMQTLGEKGFISQPHTSGGRVPTKKGYKLFVEKKLQEINDVQENKYVQEIKSLIEKFGENPQSLAKKMSSIANLLTIVYDVKERYVYEGLWDTILDEPETENPEYIKNFISTVKKIEEEIDCLLDDLKEIPAIFIGDIIKKELKTNNITLAISKIENKRESKIIVFSGFLRTDYERLLKILKALENI